MKLVYPAIFHNENGSYWVEFPDIVGCNTFGDTLDETLFNAKEALELHSVTLLENGGKLNAPSKIDSIVTDEIAFTTLIYGDISNYLSSGKAVKKTLTIPEWVNNIGVENHINFSQTLTDAIIQQYRHE